MAENIENDSIKLNINNLEAEEKNKNNNENENKHLLSNPDRYRQNEYYKDLYKNNNNNNTFEQKDSSYHLDLSRYKSTKVFGITFYHVGNIYVFGFYKDSLDPLFCIDNMWYFHLIIYFIIIVLAFVGNIYLFGKLELWRQIIYNILLFSFFIAYSILILLNPGIIIKSQKGYKQIGYCKKCNIYFLPEENTYHCLLCDVCVREIDHHCSVVRKCITKKNFIYFIAMIVNFVLLYVYVITNLILYLVDYHKKIKKN